MKTKIIIPILIIILGCNYIIGAVENPVEKTTIDYRDFEYLLFESEDVVDLQYIDSELPSSSLSIEYIDYYHSTNETKYRFTSNEITPDPWFNPGIHSFYYQDMNTGQIYIINVDYTDVEVPLSNLEILYNSLLVNYSQLQNDYNTLFNSHSFLTYEWSLINTSLSEYTNVTGKSLTNITQELVDEYLIVSEDLDKAFSELDLVTTNLEETTNLFEEIQSSHDDLILTYNTLLEDYEQLNLSYNKTKNDLIATGSNLSIYKRFSEDITSSYSDQPVYFQGGYYKPLSYYNKEIKRLNGDLGLIPAYVLLAVIITFSVMLLILKWRLGKEEPTPMEIENMIGYDQDARKLDRFSMTKAKIKNAVFNKKPKTTTSNSNNPDNTKADPGKENLNGNSIDELRTELDTKIKKEIDPIRQDISEIHTSIDELITTMKTGGL